MQSHRSLSQGIISIAVMIALAACSNGSPFTPSNESSANFARHAGSTADSILYVANGPYRTAGNVVELSTKTGKVVKTLYNGIDDPTALAVDPSGNLYVANRIAKNVSVYQPGASVPTNTISQGIVKPRAMLFDPAGDLNVLNVKTVTVYDPGSGTLLRTLKNKLSFVDAFTFDPAGDVFVINYEKKTKSWEVVEFGAGSTKVLRTFAISTEFEGANTLAFGPDGYLYIGEDNTVAVCDPTTGAVVRTIKDGVYGTGLVTFDSAGNLYVANGGAYSGIISVYAPGASDPSYEIDQNGLFGTALLFDTANDLYVVSYYGGTSNEGTIDEFKPGKNSPKRSIDNGLVHPAAAVFGP
jgi:WD40 repeat protein